MSWAEVSQELALNSAVNSGNVHMHFAGKWCNLKQGQYITYDVAGVNYAAKIMRVHAFADKKLVVQRHTIHGVFIVHLSTHVTSNIQYKENLNHAIESANRVNAKRAA